MNVEGELKLFFSQAFSEIKKSINEINLFQEDDEISPNERALKDAISNLPCAVKCIKLKIDPSKHKNAEDNSCYLIKYDLARFQDSSVEFIGEFNIEDKTSLIKAFSDNFGLNILDAERYISDFIKEFNVMGISDDDFYVEFEPFDIINRRSEFIFKLSQIFQIFLADKLINLFKFEKEIDFNVLYNLKRDTILPFSEVVSMDKINASFRKFEDDRFSPLTLEDFQNHVADIQLIPTVPNDVRKIFKCAKELYIFGYFKYYFFTVSNHYAYLALESAIKNKYNEWLGSKAILTNNKEESIEITSPSYRKIQDFCFKNKKNWYCGQILVSSQSSSVG